MAIDPIGLRFGRLKVVGVAGRDRGNLICIIRCDCGVEKNALLGNLRSGRTTSCGCFKLENPTRRTHGKSKTKEYDAWAKMKARCENAERKWYPAYGGRGIQVCDRWRESFENFYADMGARPSPAHSIDRINNDGDYEPLNCRWATATQQVSNRSINKRIMYEGVLSPACEVAAKFGVSPSALYRRVKDGWSLEMAATTKIKPWTRARSRPEIGKAGHPPRL